MGELSDDALRALLIEDPERGWRVFAEQYTPLLLGFIERSGIVDRDQRADIYVHVCEQLARDDCARLRRYSPTGGPFVGWLSVVVRNMVVDWVRSQAGRRRLFGAIKRLDPFDQRVFEMYYWDRRRPAEIAETLGVSTGRSIDVADVLDALGRIETVLGNRQRMQLLALVARTKRPISLEAEKDEDAREPIATTEDPEAALRTKQVDEAFRAVLAELPAEDAAILRLMFVQGWARHEVQRALHLTELTRERTDAILSQLRARLAARRIGPADVAAQGLTFFERKSNGTSHA